MLGPKRPVMGFVGFLVPFMLLVAVALAYQGRLFWDIGVATGAILAVDDRHVALRR